MQKLKVEVLEKMIKANLTKHEVNFILCVALHQNEFGVVEGTYYKDICKKAGLSVQGFYDCMESLVKKGIISTEKKSYYDNDITIIGNSFYKYFEKDGSEKKGYISLHCNMVRDENFLKLKAKAKLMALWLLREWKIYHKESGWKNGYPLGKETFNEKFKNLMGLTPRKARAYLGMLSEFLSVKLEDGNTYKLTFRKAAMDAPNGSQNEETRVHSVKTACRRNLVKEANKSDIKGITEILSLYEQTLPKMKEFSLSIIVKESIETINQNIKNKNKWKRYLNPSLIHHLLITTMNVAMI